MIDWSAVVLTGGRGTRLGQGEKAAVDLEGRTLLDHVLAGLPVSVPVVVVGPPMAAGRDVRFTLEEPRYGGPVAAMAAGLAEVHTPAVVVLAVDMPAAAALAQDCVHELIGAGADAVVPVDSDGRRQPLSAAYRVNALRAALAGVGEPAGRSMRDLLSHLEVRERPLGAEDGHLVADIDTPEDLAGYRGRASGPAG